MTPQASLHFAALWPQAGAWDTCVVWFSSRKGICPEAPVCPCVQWGGSLWPPLTCVLPATACHQGVGVFAQPRQHHRPECPLCLASAESDPLQAWIPQEKEDEEGALWALL